MGRPKNYYDYMDIMDRYHCCESRARAIIRSIKAVNGGRLALGGSKVLWSELSFWENNRGRGGNIPASQPPEADGSAQAQAQFAASGVRAVG